ncbi:MAG: hypothetical protein IDH49_14255 [Gammaproteobacteria bacterium]|nr:hypothetical protein [Gammaproteobacteria bacterium]
MKFSEQRSGHFQALFHCFLDVTHTPKKDDLFSAPPNVKLRGTPMMKSEQRPNADETHEPKNASPRRVPLNAMLGLACYEQYVSTNALGKKALSVPCD